MTTRRSLRIKTKSSVLNALIPGAEIHKANDVILNNMSKTKETIVFNIGGTIFETCRSTLYRLPHSPLSDNEFLKQHFRERTGHYFFDRDPEVFSSILNYLRTGKLHLPTQSCGPAIKMELDYWGIEENEIEECCWTNYNTWTTTWEALRKLEKQRQDNMPGTIKDWMEKDDEPSKRSLRLKKTIWDTLQSSNPALFAQIYGYISLSFVIASIFSFIVQTHIAFKVPVVSVSRESGDNSTSSVPSNRTNGSEALANDTSDRSADNVHSSVQLEPHYILLYLDMVCFVFFLTEFILRLFVAPKTIRMYKLLSLPMTIVEFLALVPDLVEYTFQILESAMGVEYPTVNFTFMRLLRTFRIFRLMRHFPGLWIFFYTLKSSLKELLLLLLFLCVGTTVFASLIYYTDDRDTFTSIPMACWWAVITMTTVGYGDMYPTTDLGYLVGALTAVCGVLVIGFTVPVLVNNFILFYEHTQCTINRERLKKKQMKGGKKKNFKETDPIATKETIKNPTQRTTAQENVKAGIKRKPGNVEEKQTENNNNSLKHVPNAKKTKVLCDLDVKENSLDKAKTNFMSGPNDLGNVESDNGKSPGDEVYHDSLGDIICHNGLSKTAHQDNPGDEVYHDSMGVNICHNGLSKTGHQDNLGEASSTAYQDNANFTEDDIDNNNDAETNSSISEEYPCVHILACAQRSNGKLKMDAGLKSEMRKFATDNTA